MSQVMTRLHPAWLTSLIASPLLLALLAAPAMGQGHEWITAEPKYVRAKDGAHCCGAEHCKPRAARFAIERPGGWYVPSTGQFFADDARGLYDSETPEPWACMDGELVGCLFINRGGA